MTYIVNVEAAINKDGKWLIIKRSDQEEVSPGMLALVGGKLEETKARAHVLEAALVREVFEEVDLTVTNIHYLRNDAFAEGDQMVLNMIFYCDYDGGQARCKSKSEVSQILWLTTEDILSNPDAPPWLKNGIRDADKYRSQLNED